MPTSAPARAGASLTPSPTIATVRPACWRRATSAALSSGRTPATKRSMPSLLGDRARDPLGIARDYRDLDAEAAEGLDRGPRLGADLVGDGDRAEGGTVPGHEECGVRGIGTGRCHAELVRRASGRPRGPRAPRHGRTRRIPGSRRSRTPQARTGGPPPRGSPARGDARCRSRPRRRPRGPRPSCCLRRRRPPRRPARHA